MSVKNYTCVKQVYEKDCGVSCLLTILHYYHGDASKEELLYLTNTTSKGVDLYSLANVSKKIGFSSVGVQANISSLKKEHFPCIAHVIIKGKYKHFIVLFEKDEKKKTIIIGDPALGVKRISFSYFEEITSGYYLLLKPRKKLPKYGEKKKISTYLLDIFFTFSNSYIILLLFSVFSIIFQVIMAYQFKLLLDLSITYKSYNNAIQISIFFLGILIFKLYSIFIKNTMIRIIDKNISSKLFLDLYKHFLYLPYLYCKSHSPGDILSRIQDLSSFKDMATKYYVELFSFTLFSFFSFILLYNINKTLSFLCLFSVLGHFFFMIIYDSIFQSNTIKLQEQNQKVNSYIVETLEGLETIKNLNSETLFFLRFRKIYLSFLNKHSEFLKRYNKLSTIQSFWKELFHIITLLLGTIFVIKDEFVLSSFLAFISLEGYFYDSVIHILEMRYDYIKAKSSFYRVQDMKKIQIEKREGIYPQEEISTIKIRDLSYQYQYEYIFKNLYFNFNKGEKILFQGESGNGKSTLMKIILRYLDINRGHIFINNRELLDYDISWIRKHICYISQQEFLFSDTLYNNVVSHRNLTYDDFLNVSKVVGLDNIVEKEELGYQVPLEENGFNFSGGERQRIILARSLLQNSDVYILDESLGELDEKTERMILKKLFSLYKDKLFIIISHRSTNKDLYTRVISINKGGYKNDKYRRISYRK